MQTKRLEKKTKIKKSFQKHIALFMWPEKLFIFLIPFLFFFSYFQLHTHEMVEVCAKILYQVELQRATLEQMWGFSVEAELIENADRQDELCCYVSRVEDKSVAMQNGESSEFSQNFII